MQAKAVTAVVAPIVERCGLELEDLTIVPAGKRSVVRITVDGDGPQGRGPRLDEIAACTRAVSDALDASDVTGDASYTLEVSSRGTSAPLTEPKHWRRNRGRLVKAVVDGQSVTGRIKACDESGVSLDVDGAEQHIAYGQIGKAQIQVELNRPFDPDLDDEPGDDADGEDDGVEGGYDEHDGVDAGDADDEQEG